MILEITLRCLCPLIRREVARMYLNSKSSTNEKTDALQKFDLPSYPRNWIFKLMSKIIGYLLLSKISKPSIISFFSH